jgi:hypothetical protein
MRIKNDTKLHDPAAKLLSKIKNKDDFTAALIKIILSNYFIFTASAIHQSGQ